jgi:putative ABC transport system ATP-binding protein
MDEIIRTEDLKKNYYLGRVKVEAVRGVSMSIKKGELVSIMGASGSGKSTLMHLLGCLDKPTSGKYVLDGVDVSKLQDDNLAEIRNRKIGFVFQTFNLIQNITVLENVMLPVIYNADADIREKEQKALKLLESVGLKDRIRHVPTQLSGGEMQRLAIVRALINDPLIILADEPTGDLDSKTGLEIIQVFRDLNREERVTEVIVTHDPFIASFTRRIIKFKDGLIEEDSYNEKFEAEVLD